MLRSKKGFTLIELMIVVAIIGILAAIAIPQFAQLISKSQEGSTKGNLGTVRSALSIYYGDTEGQYPGDATSNSGLTSLTTGSKYLQSMPAAYTPRTTNNTGSHASTTRVVSTNFTGAALADAGSWTYDNAPASNTWGSILISCQHTDLRGSKWTSL